MTAYIITWNLNKERENYNKARKDFLDNLKAKFPKHIQDSALETVFFVSSSLDAEGVSAKLKTQLDKNDRLFVSKVDKGVTTSYGGQLEASVWTWLLTHAT